MEASGEIARLQPSSEDIQQQRRALLADLRREREAALAQGRQRGQELFGQGALGTREQGQITEDLGDVRERRRAALEGLTPEQRQALQEQALGGIQQQAQTQLRQLRGVQGAQGVRGGAAAAQQGQVLREAQRAGAGVERDVFIRNIEAQREALGSFEANIAAEQQRRQRELLGQLTTEFGFGSLASAESAGASQFILGQERTRRAGEREAEAGKK